MTDLTSTNEKVNTGDTKFNTLDAKTWSCFNVFATLKTLNRGDVISPMKKTKIAEIPPTPRCNEAPRYSIERR